MEAHTIKSEAKIGSLNLKNRVIKAGCFEGMSQNGGVTDALIEHHRTMAIGGTAMTTVAYCSVSEDGRAYGHEMWMRESIIPELKKLTNEVHKHHCAASIQLGHCGYFANKSVIGKRPMGASPKFNLFRLAYCRAMTKADIHEKVRDFIQSAESAVAAGFDAIEIHAGHGYLLSQFLSPYTNKRTDEFGGSLENRLRFPTMIIKGIREKFGKDFPVLIKMNLYDGFKKGLSIDEAILIAKAFEAAGASALIPSSGFTSKTPFLMLRGALPVKEMVSNQQSIWMKIGLALFGRFMVQEFTYKSLFHKDESLKIKKAVNIPIIYVGGVKTLADADRIMSAGFDFVQIGRALIHNPGFINGVDSDEPDCDTCNRCVAAMDGGGVYCVSKEIGYKS